MAFANNLYVDSGHGQMYAANVVPAVLLLVIESWRATSPRLGGIVFGAAAGLLLGLLLWSTFYLGWFAIMIGAVGGSLALVLQLLAGEGRRVVTAVMARWRSIVAAVAGFALMMIGFLTTYWSALTESRGRSYEEVSGWRRAHSTSSTSGATTPRGVG